MIEEVASGGLKCKSLIGRLRFATNLDAVDYYMGIPKLYLEVEKLTRSTSEDVSCLVCATVGFRSSFEGAPRLYATYATFDSDDRSSLRDAIDWMEEEYIQGMYDGTVVTDFDEQSSRFAGAPFGLMKIMKGTINVAAANEIVVSVADKWGAEWLAKAVERSALVRMEVQQMTMKTINVGSNAQVSAPIVIADTIEGSFNTIAASKQDNEVKNLLSQLLMAVADLGPKIPESSAKSLARDADDVVKEAASAEPRPEVCKGFLDRLGKAARAIGAVAAPVATVVAALLEYYSGGG